MDMCCRLSCLYVCVCLCVYVHARECGLLWAGEIGDCTLTDHEFCVTANSKAGQGRRVREVLVTLQVASLQAGEGGGGKGWKVV